MERQVHSTRKSLPQPVHQPAAASYLVERNAYIATFTLRNGFANHIHCQDAIDTPDYTDSDTNPNTTASSVAGDLQTDGRKRRAEELQLRKSVFGKKHSRLNESKVRRSMSRCWNYALAVAL
jgi:hypothetical protein